MNKIGIFNETKEKVEELKTVKKVLSYALKKQNIQNAECNVILVDNEKIHEINKTYRGIDRPTDVISFALEDEKDFVYQDFRLLGDIYISLDKTKEQAVLYGHSFLRELSFLAVHGLLHLLGYDHMEKEMEKQMFSLQEEILNEYGITRDKEEKRN